MIDQCLASLCWCLLLSKLHAAAVRFHLKSISRNWSWSQWCPLSKIILTHLPCCLLNLWQGVAKIFKKWTADCKAPGLWLAHLWTHYISFRCSPSRAVLFKNSSHCSLVMFLRLFVSSFCGVPLGSAIAVRLLTWSTAVFGWFVHVK